MEPTENMHNDGIARWTEVAKAIVQIIAIIIGGIWTYNKFIRTEAPSLEQFHVSQAQLKWHVLPQKDMCAASVAVTLLNGGTTPVDVNSLQARVWEFVWPQSDKAFLDLNQVEATSPVFNRTFSANVAESALLGHYRLNSPHTDTFTWIFKKLKNRLLVFRLDGKAQMQQVNMIAWGGGGRPQEQTVKTYLWSPVCG
ncbi:MAG TPA: hypothetical protein VKT83_18110 [bacterium]|nr:hypothetical protein [bacterium]